MGGSEDTKSRRLPSRTELNKLFALAHGESRNIAMAVGLLFMSSGVTLSVPMGMGKIIDIIIGNAGGDPTVLTNTLMCVCRKGFGCCTILATVF